MSVCPQLHSQALPGFHGSDCSLTYKISSGPLSTSTHECSDHSPHVLEFFTSAKHSAIAHVQKHCTGKHFRVLSCHHTERGVGKTHGWDKNTSQPRTLGQIQNAFSSCSLKGMKTTQLVYTIKDPVTTALLYQLSHAEIVLQKPLGFPITTPSLSSTPTFFWFTVIELTGRAQQ